MLFHVSVISATVAGGTPSEFMHTFASEWQKLHVVLSHDWLTGMRGGERVLELLAQGFPEAPIYSLICNPEAISDPIKSHPITTTWLQRVPGIMQRYRLLLPLFPSAIERVPTPDADLLISTSHCIAKGLKPNLGMRHLCYCFTPMRYAWVFYEEYFGHSRLKRALVEPMLERLRKWDLKASERVTRFVAISEHVQKRIEACYHRSADIVYPPVNTDFYTPGDGDVGDFDLVVSALVPYKRVDLAIAAYTRLGYPLKVVGTGTESVRLQETAGTNIEFLGWQSDEAIRDLYRRCRCLVFPGEEDFGLVPVEAQACGRPVVAFGAGGALESIAEDVSGVFFDHQTEDSLLSGIEECAGREWNAQAIRKNAERFGIQEFLDGFNHSIYRCLAD